ncbi:histidine phosphatase superfamily [Phlyctochytrium arcticum]|nr:histidine phosphatase superfamily [Phlyctochytrium arcticum]
MSPTTAKLLVAAAILAAHTSAAPWQQSVFISGDDLSRNSTGRFVVTDHLGTKTAYPIAGDEIEMVDVPGCTLKQVHMVVRHGTRTPTRSVISSFNDLEKLADGSKDCLQPQHAWIRDWSNPFESQDEGILTKSGQREGYMLGKRTMARYKTLLADQDYNPNVFHFSSSARSRSGQTGNAFAAGLFQSGSGESCQYTPIYMTTAPQWTDHVLNPQKSCPLWGRTVKKGAKHASEMAAFNSARLPPIAASLQNTTCLPFTPANAVAAWQSCAFEWSVYGKQDGWCTLFSEEEVAWLEFGEDLDDWLENAYGDPLNGRLACTLVSEIVNGARDALEGQSRVLANFRFGHSETLIALVTSLGLYKDSIPLSGHSHTPQRDRNFRTSRVAPFLANMAFEVYTCGAEDTPTVRALVNEKPVALPGCPSELCPLATWEETIQEHIDCDIDAICGKPDPDDEDKNPEKTGF